MTYFCLKNEQVVVLLVIADIWLKRGHYGAICTIFCFCLPDKLLQQSQVRLKPQYGPAQYFKYHDFRILSTLFYEAFCFSARSQIRRVYSKLAFCNYTV